MNTLYYGEIAAYISATLHKNPDHILRIKHTLSKDSTKSNLIGFCADAAHVFDKVEDLSNDMFINSYHALDHYSQEMLNVLLSGQIPNIVEMVSISANSIKQTL